MGQGGRGVSRRLLLVSFAVYLILLAWTIL